MPKDAPDVTTVPPPAGGDVYAAETIVGPAPPDVIEELQASAEAIPLGQDDIETLVFGAATNQDGAEASESSDAKPPTEPDAFGGSEVPASRGGRGWQLLLLITVLVCVLMFLLGRFL